MTGSTRSRRTVAESGSFGKSTRRSRSRTGTPAARAGRENPTLAAADKIFGDWVSSKQQAAAAAASTQHAQDDEEDDDQNPQSAGGAGSQQQQAQAAQSAPKQAKKKHNHQPVEVVLRGFRDSEQQYASLARYEGLAGPILEDYSRQPPASQRRFQSSLRDTAITRRRNLTPDERAMVSRADGGEHWVKVTFECAEAADAAVYASPQRILGFLVYAELYRGVPPARDEAIPDADEEGTGRERLRGPFGTPRAKSTSFPTSYHSRLNDLQNGSPSNSQVSSQTMETGTMSSATATEGTHTPADGTVVATGSKAMQKENDGFCRKVPTARRAVLLPAEQALRPQQSFIQRFLAAIPFLAWFGGSIIGNEVPRTDNGDFDWKQASLYWKIIWWLDATFRLFQGDVYSNDKED